MKTDEEIEIMMLKADNKLMVSERKQILNKIRKNRLRIKEFKKSIKEV